MLSLTGKKYEDKKIAVIGAGPSGMSCAYYLALKGYPVTVFEKEDKPGGMLTLGIPSFRLDRDVVNAEIDILREIGVEFKCGVEVGKDVTLDALRAEGYKAFYLAVGASGGVNAGVAGDDKQGVYTGIEFLRAVNLGQTVELGKSVAVIGAGNVAIDVARTALRLGAEDVTIVYRRSRDEMPAADDEVLEAEEEGVKFRFLASPVEILGGDKVESIKLEIMELVSALNREEGITILMVLHDINHAARYSDELVVMKDHGIYRQGDPWEVLSSGDVLSDVFRIEAEITRDTETGKPIFYAKKVKGG